MPTIAQFEQVREDGKVIPESFTAQDLWATGWEPCRVILLRWRHDGRPVSVYFEAGVHAIVVDGREFIAAIAQSRTDRAEDALWILDGSGNKIRQIANVHCFFGREIVGVFGYFTEPFTPRSGVFGVTFGKLNEGTTYRTEVDAVTGVVAELREAR